MSPIAIAKRTTGRTGAGRRSADPGDGFSGATEIARTDIARLDNVRPYRKGGHRET